MAIDLGALDLAAARGCVYEYARTGLKALLTAFPTSIEALRPALHLAKDIGAPFVILVGQVMPLALDEMIPVVRDWLKLAATEAMPIQFETHRNCMARYLSQMVEAGVRAVALEGVRCGCGVSVRARASQLRHHQWQGR